MSALFDGSVVVSGLRRAARNSRVVGALREARIRLAAAADHSHLLGAVDRVGATAGRWVRSSWLYGWLTAEPEPDVIVVDLRETWTVGPVIAALDRVAGWVGPRWRASAPKRLLDRAGDRAGDLLEDSTTARLLRAVLVPPELDDRDDREE